MAASCILLCGCAQTGPPLPPSLELPKAPSDLHAARKGNKVTLAWSEPIRTTDRQTVRSIGVTRVCRSLDEEMKECGQTIAQVPRAGSIKPSGSNQPQPDVYTDTLPSPLQEQNPTAEATYAVEVLNRDGRGAGLSNRVRVPIAQTMPPPTDFSAQTGVEGVVLTWTGELFHLRESPVTYFYRAYRRTEGAQERTIVGDAVRGTELHLRLVDQTFTWEKSYEYWVTVVTSVQTGAWPNCALSTVNSCPEPLQVEGDDTSLVKVFTHDVFPPAVPAGLQAVYAGEGQKPFVDLIWSPVTDADLAGYNIYRRDHDATPIKINSELIKSPSYRDNAVASGNQYLYSVSALDVRGNESARSEEAGETVP
jgi:hypothetical protein